ncbi:MAG: hypothetical protein PHN69_06175 [Candidatus Pacebacteria bacterium]|nr:hypothetical protein [Candidatus Paceibacterota bacterium]
MTVTELKEYIYKENKIEYVLISIGCHSVKYHPNKEFYSVANKDGDNTGAINIQNNKYLNCKNYTRSQYFDEKSDLISLVEYTLKIDFKQAFKYLHDLLGLKFTYKRQAGYKVEKVDPLNVFKKVRCNKRINILDYEILDEDVLNDYVPHIHIDWFRDGIMPWTIKKFGLGYSYKYKRVIVPLRHWATGELLGTNARTTVENYDLFGIKKYFTTPSYPKSINLFGLWENMESIKKVGYVVVVESERSILKRDSLNDSTLVALSGHNMTDEQVRILIGLNVDIIISLDNDISIDEIRHMCSKFYGIRNVYYTFDKYGLLGAKESIADKPNKIYEHFIKYKIKYDALEHKKYLDSLKTDRKVV